MKTLSMLFRVLGMVQLILGIVFWTGHALTWIPVHMAIGLAFVLTLAAIGVLAARRGLGAGAAIGAIGWGILVLAVGATQQRILIGDMHWIVRVTHLVISAAAMPLGALIITRAARLAPQSSV